MGGGIFLLLAFFLHGSKAVDASDTNSIVVIKDHSDDVEYREGGNVTIKCEVVVDEELKRRLTLTWFKDGTELKDLQSQRPVFSGHGSEFTQDTSEGSGHCEEGDCDDNNENKLLLTDNSLQITGIKPVDVGEYKCEAVVAGKEGAADVKTTSKVTRIYHPTPFPWWIIVVVIILLILLVVGVIFYLKYKKGWNIKGYYDVKDIEDTGVRSDKSDVYYKAEPVNSDGKITYNQQESTLVEE